MKYPLVKIIGYAGQIIVVIVTIYLFIQVWQDHTLYDVEYSDGSDDARWRVDGTLSEYDVYELIFWAIYLLVSKLPFFLYFVKLAQKDNKLSWWTLPIFDIRKSNLVFPAFSALLSITYLSIVLWFDNIMPEVFTPTITYYEMKELHNFYPGIDSFWAATYRFYWMIFNLYFMVHTIVYVLRHCNKKIRCTKQP